MGRRTVTVAEEEKLTDHRLIFRKNAMYEAPFIQQQDTSFVVMIDHRSYKQNLSSCEIKFISGSNFTTA